MITAQKLIHRDLPALTLTDDPVNALNLMDQFRIGHLPVVDNGRFMGVISETELLAAGSSIAEAIEQEGELLKACVEPHEHILEVLNIAGEFQLSIIPVADSDGTYLGAVTLEELVNNLSRMQGAGQQGGIIVLEMNEQDYHLQQIARIIEENNAKILSLSVSQGDDGKIEVNLKVNQPDLNAILQSFNRFSYVVKASYQEPVYTEDLKKRYEELMRYLNI